MNTKGGQHPTNLISYGFLTFKCQRIVNKLDHHKNHKRIVKNMISTCKAHEKNRNQ